MATFLANSYHGEYQMTQLTVKERDYLLGIEKRFIQFREFVCAMPNVPEHSHIEWFMSLNHMRLIQGNMSNDISFLACLMAKEFLAQRFDVSSLDMAAKAQGASGLDIDFISNAQRVIGEVKTTVPYKRAKGDFGAQQKKSFSADFRKLGSAIADFKFLFVTDNATYQVLQRDKYKNLLPGVEIVMLNSSNL